MTNKKMVVRKGATGQVTQNDGDFAEIEVVGVEGTEKDLFLDTLQAHIEDTSDTPEEFQHRFPVGMSVDIRTITEISPIVEKKLTSKAQRHPRGASR